MRQKLSLLSTLYDKIRMVPITPDGVDSSPVAPELAKMLTEITGFSLEPYSGTSNDLPGNWFFPPCSSLIFTQDSAQLVS